jgi:hypothetical protein
LLTGQGCQIDPGATYQNMKNIPNDYKTYQMAVKSSKRPYNIPIFSVPRLSKIYPNLDLGYSIPSGNPVDS